MPKPQDQKLSNYNTMQDMLGREFFGNQHDLEKSITLSDIEESVRRVVREELAEYENLIVKYAPAPGELDRLIKTWNHEQRRRA